MLTRFAMLGRGARELRQFKYNGFCHSAKVCHADKVCHAWQGFWRFRNGDDELGSGPWGISWGRGLGASRNGFLECEGSEWNHPHSVYLQNYVNELASQNVSFIFK